MQKAFTRGLTAGTLALVATACSADRLTVPNYANPTPGAVAGDLRGTLNLLAAGILRGDRDQAPTNVLVTGILGREAYNYTPTEGRNTTGYLGSSALEATSFSAGTNWAGYYGQLRNIHEFLRVVDAQTDQALPAAEKNAARGFAHTLRALALFYVATTRDDLGAPFVMTDDPTQLSPWASREAIFAEIVSELEKGKTELAQGGAAFPFALHAGFSGFNTPATFLKFNRALAARVNGYKASANIGCASKTACYQTVLTNLSESFLTETGAMSLGPTRPYSSAANDVANGISNEATQHVVAHPSIASDFQRKADNTPDSRYTAKVLTLSAPKGAGNSSIGIETDYDFSIYATRASSIPIIRNEELLLLRAEARWFTNDPTGALQDLNRVRTTSGGLAPVVAVASDDAFITALLYERRYSLLFEGHRWLDVRRFGRLATLPKDLPDHVVVSRILVPQGECLIRKGQTGDLAAPAAGCVGT